MLASGFTNAPASQFLVFFVVVSALLVSITDTKHLLYVQVYPHLWRYRQLWRLFTWQLCYTNSTEVLFASLTFYHLRIIERLWGTRKFTSFLLSTLPFTTLLPPILLTLLLRPLTFNHINYLPSGPTALLFALLAQYHTAIPTTYTYRITTATPQTSQFLSAISVTLTSKSLSYLPALQLALSAFPGSLLSAAVGWTVGYAWRNEYLPFGVSDWRVPGWVLGEGKRRDGARRREFEGLRRRLEGEVADATGRDVGGGTGARRASETRRRTLGGMVMEQFGGGP